METIHLSEWELAAVYLMLGGPVAMMAWLRMGIVRETVYAVLRMTVQLWLVGIYLTVIFEFNAWWLNALWILAMLVVANFSILRQARLVWRRFFSATFAGTAIATAGVSLFLVFFIIRPSPLYDARYMIPIVGMVLGNCMRGNVLALERFYSGIRENEKEFITYHMLGATLTEAVRPYMQRALRAAAGPLLATIATMGIVSLPGMMTGQILGGSVPVTAIKYQIAIVIAIFSAMIMASVLNLLFSMKIAFDDFGMLKTDIFIQSIKPGPLGQVRE
ncbi:MAG: ABC transporter permease [Thermodesulfobacteriota bacterium]|nr:ABC transporter permease [Thermodesulfobacteriota bacterium]